MRNSWTRNVSRSLALLALLLAPAAASAQQQVNASRTETSEPAAPQELSTEDRQTLRSLANSRFMAGDVKGALDALNQIGEPRVGTIKVEGLVRTRRGLVHDYLGLKPGELLTAEKLGRIERRLQELPVASSGAVRYDAIAGTAIVSPIISERNLRPADITDWVPVGVRAAFQQEVRIDFSDVLGWGEMWRPSYRWDTKRPRGIVRLDMPAPGVLPGILRVETLLESQSYLHPSLGSAIFEQERYRGAAALSDWLTSWLRWEGGAAIDRIASDTYLAFEGNLNTRGFGDRLAVILSGGRWLAREGGDSFANGEFVVTARSTADPDVPVLSTLVGFSVASEMAPLAIWPGASSGQARGAVLRAHPLHHRGVITGDVLGRQLFFTSTEYEHPIPNNFGSVSVAAFVDTAKAALRLDPRTSSKMQVDIGGGVRFSTSRNGNKVRLDFGYGLRDGRKRISAGYIVPWGTR